MSNTICPFCGGPIDFDRPFCTWPLVNAHTECQVQSGLSVEECAQLVPCNCSSRIVLEQLGGHVVEASDRIPSDEVWYSDPKVGQIRRFRKTYTRGYLAFEMLPSYQPKPSKEGTPHERP